jgi:hypothetical protein
MLPRTVYKKCLKVVDFYRKQDEEDRKENENRIPIGWKSSLQTSLESILRENRIRNPREEVQQLIRGFVKQNLLVEWLGDLVFPRESLMPPEEAESLIRQQVQQLLSPTQHE